MQGFSLFLATITLLSLIIDVLGFSGWAFADSVLHRLAPLWIGTRGLEFTWEYIFQGIEANANLVCEIPCFEETYFLVPHDVDLT